MLLSSLGRFPGKKLGRRPGVFSEITRRARYMHIVFGAFAAPRNRLLVIDVEIVAKLNLAKRAPIVLLLPDGDDVACR